MPAAFSGDNLPFPGSLPEFRRLFPNDAACATYLGLARKLTRDLEDGYLARWCSSIRRGTHGV